MADEQAQRVEAKRPYVVLVLAVLLYATALVLPAPDGTPFAGFKTFLLGAVFFCFTLAGLPAQFAGGGSLSSHDAEWLLMMACWFANPVFWYALSKAARRQRGRALFASTLAVALASLLFWLSLSNPEHQVDLRSPAYWVWLGSIVVLWGGCVWRLSVRIVGA